MNAHTRLAASYFRALLVFLSVVSLTKVVCATSLIAPSRLPPAGSWSPGIPGGIPTNYTQFCNVKVSIPGSGLVAVGDGVTDDTAAINAALAACPNGQYVYLPTGDYRCNGTIGRTGSYGFDFVQQHFSVMLKGAGPGLTRILSYASGDCIFFSNGLGSGAGNTAHAGSAITSGNTRGSTSITANIAHPEVFTVGQWMVVVRENTAANATNAQSYELNTCSQLVRITGTSGTSPTTITFTPALNEGYAGDSVSMAYSVPYRCGIQDLYVERMTSTTGMNITLLGAQECWIKNVESRMARKWHIRLVESAGCEVRDSYVHEAWDAGGDAGYGYGLFQFSCNNLIENNVARLVRHAYVTEYGGQNNVYAYNYSKDPINNDKGPGTANQLLTDYLMEDLFHHGGSPRFNLWEGNVGSKIAGDYLLGGSDYNTFFRNLVQRKGLPTTLIALFGSDIQRYHYNTNLVGNVYAVPAAPTTLHRWGSSGDDVSNIDPQSQATAFVHGEYDAVTTTTTWDPGDADHTLPTSYYLSSKPRWFGPTLSFPAIGPENPTAAIVAAIPAGYRFLNGNPPPTPPTITQQPASQAAVPASNVSFAVSADGFPVPTFQWQVSTDSGGTWTDLADGAPYTGSATSTLSITGVTAPLTGYRYRAVATNPNGSDTTSSATLTIGSGVPPSFTTQPISKSASTADTVSFTVAATGTPTPTFQWKKNGSNLSNGGNISGATSATLTLTNVTSADDGTYSAVADNGFPPSATSNNATLTVSAVVVTPPPPPVFDTAPVITTQPSDRTVNAGATATFTFVAVGTPVPTYRWRKNGTNLSDGGNVLGATSSTLTLTNVSAADAGVYSAVAANGVGANAVSNDASLTVSTAPSAFLTQPSPITVVSSGLSVTLAVTTSGSPTLQWLKNDANLTDGGSVSGATSGTLTLTNVTAADSGKYTVVATTGQSSITSSVFEVMVLPITVASQAVTAGHSVTLSGGSASGSLQWQVSPAGSNTWYDLNDGNGYSGTRTNTLQIDPVNSGLNFNQYRLVANGSEIVRSFLLTVAAELLRFPVGIATGGSGALYVADTATDTIFKINSAGQISVLAGASGEAGSADGIIGSAARFNNPTGVIVTAGTALGVTDAGNATIRQINSAGVVSTLAGSTTARGNTDGTGSAARFSSPTGIGADSAGNFFVADSNNHTIRRITTTGAVTTFAGTAGAVGNADGTGSTARFNNPTGIAVDTAGNVYVADSTNNLIRKITPAAVVSTLAGVFGVAGSTDGAGTDALFNHPSGLAVDTSGAVYVADTGNSTIRRVASDGVVSTVAGLPGIAGLKDGTGSSAWFNAPLDVAVDAAGVIYVADTGNAIIRRITAGNVTSLVLTGVAAPPATSPPPTTPPPPPPPSSGSGGGGGGAPSVWFVGTIALLWLVRRARGAS